jgi:Tol biopolymer transport system component
VLRVVRLLGLSLALTGLGVGNTLGESPTGKLAVEATRAKWADGSSVESGGRNYPTDIYVVDVASRSVRNVTHDERTEHFWSWLPDGRRILFESVPNDHMTPGPSHIFIVDADGRNRRQLTFGTGEVSPDLAPDRRRFLFIARGTIRRGLHVMAVDGKNEKRLTHGGERPYAAEWSPNGRRIVFVRDSDAGGVRADIFVVEANGTKLRRLTRTSRDSAPAWSPDGNRIAFIRRTPDFWDLVYVMRSDGTRVKKLTRSGNNSSPFWVPNRQIVYYNVDQDRWWSIDAGGREERRPFPLRRRTRVRDHLWDRRGRDLGALSADGKWIALDTPSAGPDGIWVARADGTQRRLVTRKICCLYFVLAWSPK